MAQDKLHQRVLVLGIILAVLAITGCGSSTLAHSPTSTPTTSPAPTATATVAHLPIPGYPLAGWKTGGPTFATAIAFAPGSPAVAYACGANGTETSSGLRPIAVAFSTNSASTWTTETTPAQSNLCSLSVDPANAQDVVLFTTTCVQNCTSAPVTHLYRSRDQGQTWSELAMPSLGTGSPHFTSLLAWSGTTLFAETETDVSGSTPIKHVLVSVSAGSFVRADQGALFNGAGIGAIFALRSAVYVELFPSGCTGGYFCTLAKTTNNGASWQQVSLRYQGQSVDLLATSSMAMLIGTPGGAIEHTQIARTTNDGLSWQALPATPAGLTYYLVADGTVFLTENGPGSLYRLAPGAQQWQMVVPSSDSTPTGLDDGSLVFQVNTAGHPIAVWRDAGQDQSNNYAQYPGLQYHAL